MTIHLAPRISADPQVASGKPVIDGTGVPVEILVDKLAGGMVIEEVADDYGLAPADVLAALNYSAGIFASEEIRTAW